MAANINARFGAVDGLAQRLHEINVLDMTGNSTRANKAVDALNAELKGSHLLCVWSNSTHEWNLVDSLLFEREEEGEDNG